MACVKTSRMRLLRSRGANPVPNKVIAQAREFFDSLVRMMMNKRQRARADKRRKVIIALIIILFFALILFGYFLDVDKTWKPISNQAEANETVD
jgi:hypothetical protein